MNTWKRSIVVAGMFAGVACLSVAGVPASADAQRTIYGELVTEGTNTFRIVGYGGGFKAPSGTPLSSLDGKTVQVEVGSNRQVTSITAVPVPIEPVTHGWSVVRGVLQVTDPLNRRFTFAGDTEAYSAPPSFDVVAHDGRMVEVKLDETGHVSEIKAVGPAAQGYGAPAHAYPAPAYGSPSYTSGYAAPAAGGYGVPATGCMYEGRSYSAGAAVCQSGTHYRCDGTHWQSLGTACPRMEASDAPPLRDPRSCVISDATVAPGSSICRDGTTYRCDDGTWVNVRTPCQ